MRSPAPATLSIRELAMTYSDGLLVRRWAGAWIDFVALALILIIPDGLLGNDLYQKTIVLWVAVLALYFPLTEGLTGRSLGKLATGTRVVAPDGTHPGLRKAAIRTLLRLIEVNPFLLGGIPAGIVALKSECHQRLGDMAADTYVVLNKDLGARCIPPL
jgi:uncharacterized RDD family membrane protein YckC